jgi:hypothetical protein
MRFDIYPRHVMKKFTIALLFCTVSFGCAGGDGGAPGAADDSTRIYDQALAAKEAGELGESERLLEEFTSSFATSPDAADAESLLAEVRIASEVEGLQAVRGISQAQVNFMRLRRRYALTIEELVQELSLEKDPSADDNGYRIRMRGSPSADTYSLTAEPATETESKRAFFVDSTGIIRWALGQPATADSPELEENSSEPAEN